MGIILFNFSFIGKGLLKWKHMSFRPLMGIILFNRDKTEHENIFNYRAFPSPNGDYFI